MYATERCSAKRDEVSFSLKTATDLNHHDLKLETARANEHISLQLQMNEREREEIKVQHFSIIFQVNFTC